VVDIVHRQRQSTKIERGGSVCPQESERDGVPEVVCIGACQAPVQHGVIGILHDVTGIAVLRTGQQGRLRGRDLGAAYQNLQRDTQKVARASDAR
jgi:hypothetical protein